MSHAPIHDRRKETKKRKPYADLTGWTEEEKLARKRQKRKQWREENPDRERDHSRNRHDRLKHEVFDAYGGLCVCCGESDLHFLTIDHSEGVLPDHHRHPSGRRISGTAFLQLLKNDGYPQECRILCWNCNCSRAYYGFCPHKAHTPDQRRY